MRPVKLLSIALMLTGIFFLGKATAQIKIGTNGANIQPSSLLELESANQGFLLPRMANTIAIDALNPPNGMMIYKTTDPAGLYIRKNNQWEYITGSMNGDAVFNSVTVTGPVTAVSFSGPLNGNATSANTATTANNSLSSTVTNDLSTSQPSYPVFVTQTPGISPLRTSTTKLSFVPNTGILTAVGFNGPLVGDVTGNASSATNATNASNTDISDDISTAAVHYPTFVSGITGNLPHRTSSTNLSYTPSTGELKAVRFLGNLTGNASSSDNAITTTITNDNVSASLVYPTFVTNSSGNWGQRTANTRLTFVPSTGLLTAGSFTSTAPTGTAPLTVASNTTVANLSATNTLNTNITDDVATTSSVYPTFVTATSGNQNQRTASSRLSFIPSTGALTAISFVGSLNGNAATATTANNFTGSLVGDVTGTQGATVVSSVAGFSSSTISSRLTTVGGATSGNIANTLVLRAAGGDFTAGVISATGFVGPLTGSITGNAATVTTNANLTGEATSIGNAVTLTNAAVIAKTLTGFVSGSGTITAADNILVAIQKLNGNIGLKANIDNPVFTTGITTPLLTLGATPLTSTAARLNYLDQIGGRTGTVTSSVVLSESPTLTGTPTAPNPLAGDNSTQIATTQFVTTADNLKANIASPTFTGIPAAPTAAALTSTTQLATTAFVTTANNLKANIASPTFTGTITTPAFVISTLSAPASTDPGTAGEIRIAAGYIYVCIASGNWQRATLSGGY